MKKYLWALSLAFACAPAFAALPVKPAADQAALLKAADPQLARNKKVVYDFWREVIEARHIDLADKYALESYMQHNPNADTGLKGFREYFSKLPKQDIKPTIQRPLVDIVAERDMVVLLFVDERPDPNDATKTKKYTTTWFDAFRLENGKIAEHWDSAPMMPRPAQ